MGEAGAVLINIDGGFLAYAPVAMARLGYLYPDLTFECRDGGVCIVGFLPATTDILRRDVLYALYREKIYADTLHLRSAFISSVTRR